MMTSIASLSLEDLASREIDKELKWDYLHGRCDEGLLLSTQLDFINRGIGLEFVGAISCIVKSINPYQHAFIVHDFRNRIGIDSSVSFDEYMWEHNYGFVPGDCDFDLDEVTGFALIPYSHNKDGQRKVYAPPINYNNDTKYTVIFLTIY